MWAPRPRRCARSFGCIAWSPGDMGRNAALAKISFYRTQELIWWVLPSAYNMHEVPVCECCLQGRKLQDADVGTPTTTSGATTTSVRA